MSQGKNIFRLMSIALLAVLVVGLAAPSINQPNRVQAQGDFVCPLSEEDCVILEGALASAGDLTSVNVESLTLVAMVDAGEGVTNIDLSASGPLNIVEGGVSPFELDMTADLVVDSPNDADDTNATGARVIIKDDMGYAYNPEDGTWEVEEIGADDFEGMEEISLEIVLSVLAMLPENVVVWERVDDADGNAVFTADVRLAELLASEEFYLLIGELVGEFAGEEMEGIDPAQLQFVLGMLLAPLAEQLEESTVRLTIAIDPTTNFITGLSADIDLTVDLSFLTAMMGGEGEPTPPISVFLDFDASFSGHNETFEITVPEEAMAE